MKVYWADNAEMPCCPFKTPDTVHLLSYATIMLNTDLHRANNDAKGKKRKVSICPIYLNYQNILVNFYDTNVFDDTHI